MSNDNDSPAPSNPAFPYFLISIKHPPLGLKHYVHYSDHFTEDNLLKALTRIKEVLPEALTATIHINYSWATKSPMPQFGPEWTLVDYSQNNNKKCEIDLRHSAEEIKQSIFNFLNTEKKPKGKSSTRMTELNEKQTEAVKKCPFRNYRKNQAGKL